MTGKCKGGLLAAALVVLSAAATGCGMEEMASVWRDRPVVIDGRDDGTEWKGALHTVAKGELTVGVLNDERMLFLRLSTRNRAIQRQIQRAGFTVWFDETGGQAKTYGIRFPLPRSGPPTDRALPQGREGGRSGESMKGPGDDSAGPGAVADIKGPGPSGPGSLAAVQSDIEVFRPDRKEHSTIAAEDSSPGGLRCRLGISAGNLIYELQIPLAWSEAAPHGIALGRPRTIGIGLITGQEEQAQRSPGGPGGGGPGGGMGGDRGGRGGAMGPPPEGPPGSRDASQEKTQSVEQWLKVRLAERP